MNRKPKIRKSLFIGLGGTGAKSLIALKKRFYEVYGHVDEANASMPDFVKFMVFDTDAQGTREESKTKASAIPTPSIGWHERLLPCMANPMMETGRSEMDPPTQPSK